jgi:hypothetical protein
MKAISLVAFNDVREFIVDAAKLLEICHKSSNFDSNGAIRFGTYLRTLDGISRVGYFYTGAGGSGRLTQADYVVILEGVVAPNWEPNWILLEDNDNSHSTRGNADNKCKQAKRRLGIQCESNPPESPDLNPIETIWRTIKQRLKNRGPILDGTELRRAIQEEWDNITLEEINRAISSMPKRVAELNERNGLPIPF